MTRLSIDATNPACWQVVIDNPPINLYDPEMFAELRLLMDAIEASRDLKVVVFSSANPDYFIAHYDVVRGRTIPELPGAAPFTEWPNFVTRLSQSRVVSIAKIRGRARGHGSELALACDMRFAGRERAVFAQIEVGMGVVPGGGATEWLSFLAGRSRTLEIILGADDFDADTAALYGWINRSLPDAELDAFVEDLARRIASFDARTLEIAKKLINARAPIPTDADRWSSNHVFLGTAARPETRERVHRLMAKGLQQDGEFERALGREIADEDGDGEPFSG
ncbi:MAG: enoyl-CoA hydratase [Rhizobiales bacterium 24-66-13]|jgi:enoyl-CoA hydratase/carnithine racemase|nr:MAG: enoyl-CoA hydratase [Rhizobiales bacterium 32-66-11]OYY14023.1 MAG: enoyl-CoA hydratase [Rhizobiales bacterium 35-68-8]OYZ83113.1 MAG: enoyl-CoA hydratase [Rhizobiales bacterium 24-66-13]OZB12043.1 MAG: enoyl-CoA hydratase [Rhizobiales bacterium 39-66-18]HQS45622.1 enoyl-CoA hydratase/isomerase family protein [Xanthobacteraceae bacterium]